MLSRLHHTTTDPPESSRKSAIVRIRSSLAPFLPNLSKLTHPRTAHLDSLLTVLDVYSAIRLRLALAFKPLQLLREKYQNWMRTTFEKASLLPLENGIAARDCDPGTSISLREGVVAYVVVEVFRMLVADPV